MKTFALLLLLPIFGAAAPVLAEKVPGADATLVLYRAGDPASLELAKFYAGKRGIAPERIVPLPCSAAEEISREEYDRTIAEPVKKALTDHRWWKVLSSNGTSQVTANAIRFVAIMKGVPLKIIGVADYPGDETGPGPIANRNDAAVDSELAALGWLTPKISGPLANPYYRSFKPFADCAFPAMMLVCRLDAPTFAIAKRMLTDSLAAEAKGLNGFGYVDSRGITDGGLAEGDRWLGQVVEDATKHGIPVIADTGPEMFPEHYPMTRAAFYYGWYSEQPAGAFASGSVRFVPGAVAIHLHSFSAATLRDPLRFWVGPLLAQGAAATIGNVYEPYLAFTPSLDLVENRLREGFSFAESAYSSMRAISWMTTFIGDPLYRPYRKTTDYSLEPAARPDNEWAAYAEGARLWFEKDRYTGERALQLSAAQLKSGVIYEALAGLQAQARDVPAALASFADAARYYKTPDDIRRVVFRQATLLHALRQDREALALARRQVADDPASAPLFHPLLEAIEPRGP